MLVYKDQPSLSDISNRIRSVEANISFLQDGIRHSIWNIIDIQVTVF
jgi:hypothetical protein